MKVSQKKSTGFTLVELLVVIAIIALLVAIVFPAINNALLRGRVTATSVNGRNIYQAIIGAQTSDIYLSAASVFPNEDYDNTREYFDYLVTSGVLNVGWSFFSAPGVPATSDRDDFIGGQGDQHNAWRIVDRSERLPETAPFLMTKNIAEGPVTLGAIDIDQDTLDDLESQPFQSRGFAFVTRGGGSYALAGDQFMNRVMTELFRIEDRNNNPLPQDLLLP